MNIRQLLTVVLLVGLCSGGIVAESQSPTSPLMTPTLQPGAVISNQSGPLGGQAGKAAPDVKKAVGPAETGTAFLVNNHGGGKVYSIHPSGQGSATVQGKEPFTPALSKPVEYGPAPEGGQVLTIAASGEPMPVTMLLDQLVLATGWNVVTSPEIEQKRVRFWVTKVTPQQVLEVLKFNGIYYNFNKETNYLYISTVEEYLAGEYGAIQQAEFMVKHADVVDMETILTSLMSPQGRIVSDPRTGRILVWDTQDNLGQMKKTLTELDVPLAPRIFPLKYIDADTLLESVQSLLTQRGLAQADPRLNTLVITDLPSRLEQIGHMIEALDKPIETRTWTLNYVDPKELSERIENLVPEEMGGITVDDARHQLSVTAIPARLEEVDKLVKDWDVKPKQVQIEAYLVAAGTTVARNLGVSWSYFGDRKGDPFAVQVGSSSPNYTAPGPDTGQRLTIGSVPYQVALTNPWTSTVIRDISGHVIPSSEFQGDRLGIVLDYLETQGDVRVLSRPRITVQDGEEASFEQTQDRPYQQGGYSQYTSTDVANPSFNRVIPLQVQFVKVGTVLKVKPRINEEGNILMEISAEDSSADSVTVTTGDQKSTVPQKKQNKAETKVLSHDGETIVIGGMRASTIQDDLEKVPFLGDVPFLGRVFRNTKKDHQDRELLIFITASVVDEYTRPEAERLSKMEEAVTDTMRNSKKPLLDRMASKLSQGANEIGVSIGQTGTIYSKGELKTLDELKADFAQVKKPDGVTVIVRAHPEAPKDVREQVVAMAKEAKLHVEIDDSAAPFVPPLNAMENRAP